VNTEILPAASASLDAAGVRTHPWCGPADRRPAAYRGPHKLSARGWLSFVERLERREEIAVIRACLAGNRQVLDVGGGTGEITRQVAVDLGQCVTVEPHGQRLETLRVGDGDRRPGTGADADMGKAPGILDVHPGRAERLPFPDDSFDAVLSTWVLPYVDDLPAAVGEMARVCDATRPEAKIVLIGGAPDNELVALLNEVCVPIASEPRDHQGFVLSTAAAVLAGQGFGRFSLFRTEAAVHFPEPSPDERARAAAEVLVAFWYDGHPKADHMRAALVPALLRHFARRPHAIGDQGVVLVARP
jgi:SAM-dependent methyltransferase